MAWTEIICLANSRKHGGRCVAGLRTDGGGWVRLACKPPHTELTPAQCKLDIERFVQPLDVFAVDLRDSAASPIHPEDMLFANQPLRYVRRISAADLALVRTNRLVGPALFGCTQNKVAESAALASSLAVLEMEKYYLSTRPTSSGSSQLRVSFACAGQQYDLPVTQDDVPITHSPHGALLTVSVGEPYNGFCYKLVATVLPKKK
ncbi:MAG: dual OB domain-containing protein [Candidatus Sumerlaeaceae bacterium]